jgi:uncharacterized membrane protein YhfC
VGLLALIYWHYKSHPQVSAFIWGALAWTVAVGLKFAIALPFNRPFLLYLTIHYSDTVGSVVFSVYLGLLTGIFECLIPYYAIRLSKLKKYSLSDGIAFGVGFGAIEAILLGVYALLRTNGYVGSLLLLPVGSVERISAIIIHTVSCLLLFVSVRTQQTKYLWLSVSIKTVVDGVAGGFLVSRTIRDVGSAWMVEFIVGMIALASLALVPSLLRSYKSTEQDLDPGPVVSMT